MLAAFIVTFREILEVALILGVVLASTKGLVDRARWVWGGIAIGVAGSLVVAYFIDSISGFAEGMGQELFNAIILFTASGVIGWTAIWMRTHASEMVKQIKEKGGKIVEGELHKATITAIIALAVLREGSEIVLFTYGMLASGQNPSVILTGSLSGIAAGSVAGGLLYAGLISIPTKYIFQVTMWLLLLLSAGMASIGAKYLVAAGYFDKWTNTVWDMSSVLSEDSLPGQILHALFGYSEQPMVIQLLFYFVTLTIFLLMMKYSKRKKS